jgi:hypothetical protein
MIPFTGAGLASPKWMYPYDDSLLLQSLHILSEDVPLVTDPLLVADDPLDVSLPVLALLMVILLADELYSVPCDSEYVSLVDGGDDDEVTEDEE